MPKSASKSKAGSSKKDEAHGSSVVQDIRERVQLHKEHISHVSATDYPGNYVEYDDSWNFETFKEHFRVDITKYEGDLLEFDMIGCHASLANAIRRILLSEVPTMAIEHVYVMNNTSIIPDEVLAHRLGLIPIKADPRMFQMQKEGEESTDLNTLVLKLNVKCEYKVRSGDAMKTDTDETGKPEDLYTNATVYSGQIEWSPEGQQADAVDGNLKAIGPVHDDIIIAKMRPGQELDLEMHCKKGIGKTHAKWQPVGTASYRLLPEIRLLKAIENEEAERLQECFVPGVIELEKGSDGVARAKVGNPRLCTVGREVLHHTEFNDKVALFRKRDHFLFFVESLGILPPKNLVTQSLEVLKEKCLTVQQALKVATDDS
eukprot:Clim_evm36s109 gene=Clim_evmTU36s109